jgi:hypothetical protein
MAGMGNFVRPAVYHPPPAREQIPYELLVQVHAIRVAAEHLAGLREAIRDEGVVVEALGRVETHLVWVMEQVDAVAAGLKAAGWRPPPAPRPDLGGVVNADRHPPWSDEPRT